MNQEKKVTLFFVSLGCDKNLVDSEMMITSLREYGFMLVNDETEADVIVVNTCCFIGDAKEESINTLLEMAQYKEEAECKLLVAAGCLAQRYHEEIQTEIPEVDIIVGTMGYEKLAETIQTALKEKSGVIECLQDINYLPQPLTNRDSMSGGYFAYLKIAEGCDKHCTYCVIPKVRGNYRSVPMDNLVAQAKHLVDAGARELILVAQETTLYGVDLYGKKSLPELLERLSELEELRWIRIMYCYPEEITEELVQAIKRLPKVCHYLDIPVQHGADAVLKRMGRKTSRQEIEEIVARLREEIPDIALRTTLITGFPGETEEDFMQLKQFVESLAFDRLGVFTYSREEDTPAAEMENQVPEELAGRRRDEIMALQQEIAFDKTASQIGRTMEVMVEGRLPEEGVYITRTYMDAPEVDGYVFVSTDWNLMSGDFLKVCITGADEYDLIGEIVEDE
ncbi:MAG: 30S ribosomal protein S12 methylthiotransferase RimO [Lachnospiraceae bacterium]|nr:30S ribosomal protein S12 methylthiotransferase RimO [Lachnospiraceae bacterium]